MLVNTARLAPLPEYNPNYDAPRASVSERRARVGTLPALRRGMADDEQAPPEQRPIVGAAGVRASPPARSSPRETQAGHRQALYWLPPVLIRAIAVAAARRGIPRSELVADAVRAYLDAEADEGPEPKRKEGRKG